MLDKIKQAFRRTPADPRRHAVEQALLPLRALSDALHARAVDFVLSGDHPEVMLEVEQQRPDATELLGAPGQFIGWFHFNATTIAQLRGIGIEAMVDGRRQSARPVFNLRDSLYRAAPLDVPQTYRFARILTAAGGAPSRAAESVPDWFVALVNDLIVTFPPGGTIKATIPEVPRQRAAWTAAHLGALLSAEAPDLDAPTTLTLALFADDEPSNRPWVQPAHLPGVAAYLAEHSAALDIRAIMQQLSVSGRTHLVDFVTARPNLAARLGPLIAGLSADTSVVVRRAAAKLVLDLDAPTRARVLPPVLATLPASRAGELVEILAGLPDGAELLSSAAEANPKLATLVSRTLQRHDIVADADAPAAPIELPPVIPLDDPPATRARAEIRRGLDRMIARDSNEYLREKAQLARQFTDADIDQVIAVAEGRLNRRTRIGTALGPYWLLTNAPSLTLLHMLRIFRQEEDRARPYYLLSSYMEGIDPRAIEAALAELNLTSKFNLARYAWGAPAEVIWPWAISTQLDAMAESLSAPGTALKALEVLTHSPSVPPTLVPKLAALAVGTGRASRTLAQQVLTNHPAAQQLAVRALDDSRGEIRAAAASWLGTMGDSGAIPSLRAALKKEKREVVRASLLSALQACGDDVTGDLSPEALGAEAAKGLRAKPPASLSWFVFEALPPVRWADGNPVDPAVIRWWVILADKLKNPDGQGLIDLYLGLLQPADAAALGTHILRAWIAEDTRKPNDAESRAYATAEGARRYADAQQALARTKADPDLAAGWLPYVEQSAAVSEEVHVAAAYAEHQSNYLSSAISDKGLLAFTTRMPGAELAAATQAFLRQHPARRSQASALVQALASNGQPAALQVLLSVSRRFKAASVQKLARELVDAIAEERGWSPDELADRTIPDAGFGDDGLLRLDYGSREIIGRLTPAGAIALATADGKAIKSLPAARQDDDAELVAEAKKLLTTARKEAKSVVTLQTSRLYEAMCTERTWSASDWQSFLAGHPLMSQLVARLIWVENPHGLTARAFRPTEDGALIGIDDEPVTLAPDAVVALAHRTSLGDEAAAAWRTHLSDYDITPLFGQLDAVAPAVPPEALAFEDLRGHMTDTFTFRGLAGKRGYDRAPTEDGGWFTEYIKEFSGLGLTAVIEFTGSYLPEENMACATETLSFRRGSRTVPLDQVPPILLAEAYADYAAFAALGPFDPAYHEKSGV